MNPPNVVLILSDQLRAFELGCYGNPTIRTPNIDRLAAGGVRFEVACSNSPLCGPARSALLSGQYARTCNGMLGGLGEAEPVRRHLPDPTLAEVLRAAGYETAIIGSWNVQPRAELCGFQHRVICDFDMKYSNRGFHHNDRRIASLPGWCWDHEMEAAREFLAAPRERPFFLYFNIDPPHMPLMDSPEHYRTLYSRDEVTLRPNVFRDGAMVHDPEWFRIYLWDTRYYRDRLPHTLELPVEFDLRDLTALYDGMVSLVDNQVGKLLAALQEHGLMENTIVVLLADHGDNLGSHGWFNKMRLTDESIRIPTIYRWPGKLAPQVASAQVTSQIDVMPTLLSLCGIPVPGHVQGTDVSPVLLGKAECTGENAAYIEFISGVGGNDDHIAGLGIRTVTHTYGMKLNAPSTYSHDPAHNVIADDRLMFFDNLADPYQMHNLAADEADSEVGAELRPRLVAWHERTPWRNA